MKTDRPPIKMTAPIMSIAIEPGNKLGDMIIPPDISGIFIFIFKS